MKNIKLKAIFSMLIVVVMILNLIPFSMIKVLAKEPTNITKIEINNLDLTFNDAMRGTDAKIQVKEYTFPENAGYSRGNDNVWINQDDHGVYEDKLVAGQETIVDIEVFAKQVGMNVENPDYDFDEDHLDQIEVWINGVKRNDVRVTNYNSSWRCVDVYIPATVVEYTGPKHTVSFNTQGGSSVESQQVAEGYYVSRPEKPTKENEVFTGWYTDPECTEYFYFERNKIMQDTTIYAGWRPKVETQYIDKIEFNNLNLELNNSMTGFDAKNQIKQYTFPENANYSRGNDNVWINQDDHGVYGDKLLAGYETTVTIEVYAKQFGMDVENPDYDFDEDHLDQIEVWINGEKRDDAIVTNYNTSWRCVDVRIPATVINQTKTEVNEIDLQLEDLAAGKIAKTLWINLQDKQHYGITGNAIIIPSYVNLGDEFTYEDGERFAAGETYRVLFNYNIDKDNYTEGQDLVVKFNGNVATKTISPLDGETEYYEALITLPGGTKYTVTFETYGGAPVPENQLVLEGKKATKPSTDPQKGSDLVFGGWYTDTTFTTPFNFNNPITENTTIYAKWNEKGAYTQGDLDRNGVVDANDASVALELYKAQNATTEDVSIGDMDSNNLIDANDASLILEYYKTHQ